jgi:hypothetical protein
VADGHPKGWVLDSLRASAFRSASRPVLREPGVRFPRLLTWACSLTAIRIAISTLRAIHPGGGASFANDVANRVGRTRGDPLQGKPLP